MSSLSEISVKISPNFVKLFTIITVLTISLFGSLVWHVWDTFRYLETTQKNYFRLAELSGQIVHLDEVLTMSARMAAATGDQYWEVRYRDFEWKLDAAIKEAIEQGQRFSLKDAADETNTANLKLVNMENIVFDLVRKGQTRKAAVILSSDQYNLQKKIYITGITKITETIKERMGEDITQYRRRVYWAIGSILIVTPCLILGWFFIIKLIRQYNANRQRSAELLLESEERFRSLFQNIHIISLVVDPKDGTIIDANPAASSFYGWSHDELLGKKISQINTLPEDEILREIDSVLKENRSYFMFQHRRADGSVRDVEVYSGPIRVGDRELLYSIIHDISERKQMDEKLCHTSTLLRIFMDAINESAFLMDKEWRILEANETVAKRFNKTVQELIGSRIEDIFSLDIVMKRKQYIDEVFRTGKTVRFEDERLERTIDNVIYPVINSQGEVFALAIIGFDITARKLIEQRLQKSEERFRSMFDDDLTGDFIVDANDFILACNPAFIRIFGYNNADELIGKPITILYPDLNERTELLSRLSRENKLENYQTFRRRKDGEMIHVVENIVATLDVMGNILEIKGYIYDDTKRKDAEERVNSLLAEKELILKEVHHRLKNNMNTVHGLLTLQAGNIKDNQAISVLEDAANRVRSMMVLYDKLYRSDNFQNISLKDYIPSLVDEIIDNFPNSKSVKIEKKIDNFVLDAKKLQSLCIIINELITNIMKYAFIGKDNGLISISASLKETLVTFVMYDNGLGMPESVNFENSAGFGLQLIWMLSQELHGTIKIERGNGTKIVLEFNI